MSFIAIIIVALFGLLAFYCLGCICKAHTELIYTEKQIQDFDSEGHGRAGLDSRQV